MLSTKRILLIIGGGIAAYKCLDLIRRLREQGIAVRVVMTKAAQEFVTPLSVGALSNDRVFIDLFDLNDEREIGHIRLSREADLIVVAPATADLLAKMAGGHANDLATSVLLATDKPVLVAPAMNPRMWLNPATRRNTAQLKSDGIHFIGPATGEMAEANEAGPGRLVEVLELVAAIEAQLAAQRKPAAAVTSSLLAGRHVLITSGPTHEPIDPVRYIANRSSGKQGHAIAAAAARAGARVTLVSGPVSLADPVGVAVLHVETAAQMMDAVRESLPADIAVFTAAVADWRVAGSAPSKMKKARGAGPPKLDLVENDDILRAIASSRTSRPNLVIGFAAETDDVVGYARKKRKSKNADWIVANDVSPSTGIMGGDRNRVHLVTASGVEDWPEMAKDDVAERLIARAAQHLNRTWVET
ncbi:MAG: bifunctional phosphopantothenoylcysteine decarboxylase/phosphopantothenate--cysteine ligase CoaBC [Hyphomicrobiaceae bacterium]|nr:bifunctional phosphopantothenoylcysteine decarboxylase/phosphopantothenate--cysteine ligase CoaBC [Hyphomicrobiaceae bacterium]